MKRSWKSALTEIWRDDLASQSWSLILSVLASALAFTGMTVGLAAGLVREGGDMLPPLIFVCTLMTISTLVVVGTLVEIGKKSAPHVRQMIRRLHGPVAV